MCYSLHTIGVGSGPKLMDYVKGIFKVAYVPIDFEVIEINPKSHQQEDDNMMIFSLLRNRIGIKVGKTVIITKNLKYFMNGNISYSLQNDILVL